MFELEFCDKWTVEDIIRMTAKCLTIKGVNDHEGGFTKFDIIMWWYSFKLKAYGIERLIE